MIGDAQPAQLDVVFRRNDDLGIGFIIEVAAPVLGAPLRERGLVAVRPPERRLVRGGPVLAAVDVAQINERSPVVARGVLAPASDREFPPAAISATCIRDHHVQPAVRKQLHFGGRRIGTNRGLRRRLGRIGENASRGVLGNVGMYSRRLGDSLLQQHQRGLKRRLGLEAPLHRTAEQRMRQRDQVHALVVCHERSNDRDGLPARQSRGRVVRGFVESERALHAEVRQPLQVRAGFLRNDQERERGGIRRDDQVFRETSRQAEPRHAERVVLVIEARIDGVVARFRHAPGQRALPAIGDLSRYGRSAGLVQQRAVKSSASRVVASGTRTSSRSMTRAPYCRRWSSAGGRARTSIPAAVAPARPRRSW